jgi:Sec-independent protein translocase protein TatA
LAACSTDDVARIGADNCTITPTGAAFLQPSVRPGILPAILSALMSARATTRGALKGVQKELQQARHAQQQQQQQQQGQQAGSSAAAADANKHAGDSVLRLTARAAVLDGRQKALKLTANALYVSCPFLLACSSSDAVPLADNLLSPVLQRVQGAQMRSKHSAI